jgi:hypothetical protein
LNFTYRVGLTFDNAEARSTRGAFNYSAYHLTLRDHGTLNITSAVTNSSATARRITSEIFANANKRFGKFGISMLLGSHTVRPVPVSSVQEIILETLLYYQSSYVRVSQPLGLVV